MDQKKVYEANSLKAPKDRYLVCSVPEGRYNIIQPYLIGNPYSSLEEAKRVAIRFETDEFNLNPRTRVCMGSLEFLVIDDSGTRRY